jgi:hypothetical protein
VETAAAGISSEAIFRRVSRLNKIWGNSITMKAIWHVADESGRELTPRPSEFIGTNAEISANGAETLAVSRSQSLFIMFEVFNIGLPSLRLLVCLSRSSEATGGD